MAEHQPQAQPIKLSESEKMIDSLMQKYEQDLASTRCLQQHQQKINKKKIRRQHQVDAAGSSSEDQTKTMYAKFQKRLASYFKEWLHINFQISLILKQNRDNNYVPEIRSIIHQQQKHKIKQLNKRSNKLIGYLGDFLQKNSNAQNNQDQEQFDEYALGFIEWLQKLMKQTLNAMPKPMDIYSDGKINSTGGSRGSSVGGGDNKKLKPGNNQQKQIKPAQQKQQPQKLQQEVSKPSQSSKPSETGSSSTTTYTPVSSSTSPSSSSS